MKIKNLAFFGIMAAIMGVAGTARADTTTVIASQAYVDAKDALKQNLLKSGDGGNIVEAGDANGNVITGITADGRGTVTVTKGNLNLSSAVSGLNLTDAQATGTGVVKTVTQTNGQIAVTKDTITNDDVASNAAIADTKIAFSTAHASALDSGITSTKVSGYDTTKTTVDSATGDNVVATRIANTNLLKGTGLQNAVAHLKGNGAENYTANVDNSNVENTGIKNETVSSAAKTAWNKTLTDKEGDNYLTTLAAVERRVQEGVQDAVSQAGTNVSGIYANQNLSNLTETGKANVSALGTYNSATDYTDGTVGAAIKGKQDKLTFDATPTAASTNPVTSGGVKTALDDKQNNLGGTVDGVNTAGKVVTATETAGTVKYTSIDAAVTAGSTNLVTSDAVQTALDRKQDTLTFDATPTANSTNPVTSGGVKTALDDKANKVTPTANSSANSLVTVNDQGIVTGTATAGALAKKDVITYATDTDSKLSNVNASNDAASAYTNCTVGSPCTLTMIWDRTNSKPVYEWTNMDTESTDAVL